ncbi:MAG: eukaryotic-like serine/threonine-protein kinase [Blastocatellia bacterium]|jgi:serine/threonine-protein kinase|nr:eukaryotic-like serine/threonine-protein kinase [Blastocatellia bacterium]
MIGATLGNYKILEKIGEGGQGTVYKAIDTKLGRPMVVKVLPPELTLKEANLKRFQREARLASALDHPNICTIFDMNEIGDVHFIAMQYVEGQNVRQLVNGRPLDLASALSITIQVADALATAHAQGIIHRDIKAGNVMVTRAGKVKVLDFGLAKLIDDSEAVNSGIHHTDLTELGVPYGTATYAAPEQARGDRVDSRADIFSTGVLLYEMLTGIWPFQGRTSVDVRHAVLHEEPKPLAEARTGATPPRLQEILDRAMAKDPRQRYQKIAELRDDLRAVLRQVEAGGGEMLAESMAPVSPRHMEPSAPMSRALRWLRAITGSEMTTAPLEGASGSLPRDMHETPVTSMGQTERKTVAILPFRNLSNDPAVGFYEFSLADAVITELARVRSLVVRPSSLIAKYQGSAVDPEEVGRQLGVNAVLAAGFLKVEDQFRVTAQLLDVKSGEILWSDRIDVAAGNIITVQDTIVQRIVAGLRLELTAAEVGLLGRPATVSSEAYEEYLRGRDALLRFINRTVAREDFKAAVDHFCRAIKLDQKFALAYSGLGVCFATRVVKGFGDADDYDRAEKELNTALSLDPQLVEARLHMIYILMAHGEKQKARDEIKLLRAQAPNEAAVHRVAATIYRLDGEHERALRSYDRVERLDPSKRVVMGYNRARLLMFLGRSAEAMRELDQAAAIEPDHPLVKTFRALSLYHMGDSATATKLMHEVLAQHPNMHGVRPILAMCLSAQGDQQAAIGAITELAREAAAADHDSAYWLASAYALIGKREEALEWLERAIKLGNENRVWFEKDRNWIAYHDDPEFQKLLNSIKVG